MEANRRLIEAARPMSVSFHRAFDRSADPFKALEDIIELGCERILTSGQQPKAIEGVNLGRTPEEGCRQNNSLGW